jgi:hypothetical protein
MRNMKNRSAFVLIITLFLCASSTYAQPVNTPAATPQRVALVIGNSEYETGPLLNPVNDAKAMANALRRTGFDVLEYINVQNLADMKRAVRAFGTKIQNGGVGLFYYAGHGIQVDGKNYLVPTMARIYSEEEVEYESIDVGFILAQMEIARNRMNILILDACRNNPFARSWRSSATGLAFINAPAGTLIAYATSPGSVASDGTGENGLYTEELLQQVGIKGLKIEDVFKNVRVNVMARSNNLQTPWESSSLVGDFYFVRPDVEIQETFIEEVIPEIVETSDAATFKVVDSKYFFYRDGRDITGNTVASTVQNDVLLYDQGSNRNYLLSGYWNIRDENFRPAEELLCFSNAFWQLVGENQYRMYLKGKEITQETRSSLYDNNWLVYHKSTGDYYVFNDVNNSRENKLYQAFNMYSTNNTLWWADENNYYYLYVNGEQIAYRTYVSWSGNDLVVYDEEGQSSYLLRDYYNSKDKSLRSAEILAAPGIITYSREGNTYYLYRNGESFYYEIENSWSESDLLVFDKTNLQTYLLQDYAYATSGTSYTAKTLFSRNHSFWRKKDNNYYLYIEGVLQYEGDVTASYNGNDLEVYEMATGLTWILTDYATTYDNVLRPAVQKLF